MHYQINTSPNRFLEIQPILRQREQTLLIFGGNGVGAHVVHQAEYVFVIG
jgi:hypothetical protein